MLGVFLGKDKAMPHAKQTDWTEQMVKIFVPQEYLNDFEINHIEEQPEEWVIELVSVVGFLFL